jgi:hypothetical protein
MAAKWTSDSQEVLDIIGKAYGSASPSHQDMATRKPTVVTFGKDEMDALQARIRDAKLSFSAT